MKKIFILCALLLTLLPGATQATTISLWTSEIHEERLAVIRYLTDVFSMLRGDVEVNVVSVNENELVNDLVQAIGSEACPSLVSTGSELIVALGEKGLLDTAKADAFIDRIGRERFYAGALRQLSMPDQRGHYGIPYHGWVQGVWYRADWFQKESLAPPNTWDALLTAARHFQAPEKGTYGILVGTADDQYTEQVFTQLAQANNAQMFDTYGTLVFNRPAMVKTLKYYLALAENTPPGPQSWRARDYYLQGHMAMFFYSTFIMDDLALKAVAENSLTGDNFNNLSGSRFDPDIALNTRLAPLITQKRPSGYGMINGFGLLKSCTEAEAEATQAFLEFLFQPTPYVEWLHMAPGGMLPVLTDMAESEAFMRDPLGVFRRYGRPKIREILSGLENISNFGMVDGHRFPQASLFYAKRIIPKMIQKALSKAMTPQQAVDWAEGEMLRIMAEQ